MKKLANYMAILGVSVGFLMSASAGAQPATAPLWANELETLRNLALKCSVQTYSVDAQGRKILGFIQSICPEVSIDGEIARFHLGNQVFSIEVVESPNSDGGDLDTVYLVSATGERQLVADDVPSFGDPLYALLGQLANQLPERLVR